MALKKEQENENENENVYVYDIAELLPSDPFNMEEMEFIGKEFIKEINLILPIDPFGMGLKIEATFDITGWKAYGEVSQDFKNNDDKRIKSAEGDSVRVGNNRVIAEIYFLSRSVEYNCEGEEEEDWESEEVDADSVISTENNFYNRDDLGYFGCEKYEIEKDENNGLKGGLEVVKDNIKNDDKCEVEYKNNGDGGAAAMGAIIFVVRYLNVGVKNLLSIESVCKSLRDAVRNDRYLWTKIHIDDSLSNKICNDDLLKLTDRAEGELCSLALVKCTNITNDGLQRVLERNLKLTKLSVAGCMKLSLEGVLNILKMFNSIAKPGIKHLRIGDIKHLRSSGELRSITNEHLRELKLLLGAEDEDAKPIDYKPRFYREGDIYLSLDDERVIDIETCPRCQMLKQVYDCSTEDCRVTKTCRACIICIARCTQCGCCLEDKAYEEGFSFEICCCHCCPMGMTSFWQDGLLHAATDSSSVSNSNSEGE